MQQNKPFLPSLTLQERKFLAACPVFSKQSVIPNLFRHLENDVFKKQYYIDLETIHYANNIYVVIIFYFCYGIINA